MSTPAAPRRGGGCSCGGCLATLLVLVLVLVVAVGLLYRAATTPYLNLPAIATSSAAAESAQQKISVVSAASDRAKSTGKPVPVTVTLTDAEMTSLATQAIGTVAQTGSVPAIEGVVIHAAGSGIVQVQARVHFPLITVPLYLALQITSPDQKSFSVTVTEARVGIIPLPVGLVGGIVDQVRRQLVSRVNVAGAPAYDHARVTVAVGKMTLGATFEP